MQPSAPTYRWVCHKCEATNDAGKSLCAACGFPAVASAQQISPSAQDQESNEKFEGQLRLFLLFFPEIIPAAAFVLFSPYVAGSYFFAGYPSQGVLTLLLAAGGTTGFVLAAKKKQRYIAWVCVAAIVFGMFLISDSCPKSIF
ncbi:hypothetical protein [Uliginosibacterium sp. 31-12]|uniref:hypothetical protein n=1 Tax=Uliginosibacterium sp. 31-12 TaxID=3062781 RepID=UPI0026E279A0|nr:hypothetical protein [Uliginosibacterium sp. 31-12]MDO6388469.1 hypothetical protein [Uliginosibacterium sp. 31-12]